MYQIGIDIGGTNVKIGLLNEALELCAEISIPFPHTTAEDMAAQIRAAVGPMLQARGAALSDVESLGAVVPGSIDAAGETVVTVYSDAGALDTVSRIREQELQLEQLQFALESYLDSDAALKLDSSITDSILTLRGELADGDYSTASENVSALKAAILKRSHSYSSSEEIQSGIDQVKSELSRLRASLSGAVSVRAEKPGIYSAACDGYEDVLTPDTLADLTVSRLENLTAGSKGSSLGKLIYGDTWYYAAAVTQEEAQRIAGCGSVSLRLTKGITDDIAATVHSVGPAEDGRCVVVLACREYLAETTQLRHQTAQIVLHSYTGLRLPSVCLRQQEDGTLGVYCAQGSFSRFKPVDMVYQGDDYVLVSVPQNTDGLDTLRPGDEVIMTGVTLDGSQILTGD